ncbi:MAG: AMP-binding protein [Alphaproteobacteria bacterium]|nr:AMP-binding protein [Alphaproteobacteria bacterium]
MSGSGFAWRPSPELVAGSNLRAFLDRHALTDFTALEGRLAGDPEWFWDAVLRFAELRFPTPYTRVIDSTRGLPWTQWCVGGTTNVVLNTLDRHRGTAVAARPAIVWEAETGERKTWSYAELDREASRLAGALRQRGIGAGDVVAIYLPLLPETVAALYAVLRLGAIAMPLYSGFAADALAQRLNEAEAKAAITCDGTRRRGQVVAMKAEMDGAARATPSLKHVIVHRLAGNSLAWQPGRDSWWQDAVAGQPDRLDSIAVPADDPAMLIFTSGTSGRPKGIVVTHCGVLGKMTTDFILCADLKPTDRFMWFTDFGWAVAPYTTIACGMQGATLVLGEGAPDFPDEARMWRMVQDYSVSVLGSAPTAIRSLMRQGPQSVAGLDLSSLRVSVSGGEPWTEEAWHWFFRHIGKARVPMLNWSGGTEITGGILFGTLLHPVKPCAFTCSIPGMQADVVDEQGRSSAAGEVGELVLRAPSIGLTRGFWRDREQYLETYWSTFPDLWRQGDLAVRDADGQWFVTGRSDDTLKISGKRTGPAEIEGLLTGTGLVSEAAAVGLPDPISGQAVSCVCVPAPGARPDAALAKAMADAVAKGLGRSFRPKRVVFVADLPKNRSLKILRRTVKAVLLGEPPGDLSTMLNPEAVAALGTAAEQSSYTRP